MKVTTIALLFVVTMFPTFAGSDILEQNKLLKKELAEKQVNFARLQDQYKLLKDEITNEKNVIELRTQLLDKIGAASESSPTINAGSTGKEVNEQILWDFKLNSRQEYYGKNDFPEWATIVDDSGRKVLQIVNEDVKSNHCLVKYFSAEDFEKVKGKKLTLTISVKGENIGKSKGSGKFMLMVPMIDGKTEWPDAHIGKGTFDWSNISFTFNMPNTAKNAAMIIGLQDITGKILFKDMKIVISE